MKIVTCFFLKKKPIKIQVRTSFSLNKYEAIILSIEFFYVCVGHVIGSGLSQRTVSNIAPVNNLNNMVHMNGGICGGATLTRPRPQPIAGTPPPDPNEKCDAKVIQQTCNLFGLDLVSF